MVCGAMKELGGSAEEEHDRIRRLLEKSSVDYVFLYGAEFRTPAFRRELKSESAGRMMWTDNFDTLQDRLRKFVRPGDLVLLKGSRSMALERLVDIIQGNVEV